MDLIDKENDRRRAGLHFVNQRLQTRFELPFHPCARLQHADIKQPQLNVNQRLRHVATGDTQCQAFDHGSFTYTSFTGQQWVILATAHQDIDHLADLFVAPDNRIDLAITRTRGEILAILGKRSLLSRCSNAAFIIQGDRCLLRLFAVGTNGVEIIQQRIGADAIKLRGDAFQYVGEAPGFQDPREQVTAANAGHAKFQRTVDPCALNRCINML